MMPALRASGMPSAIAAGTHSDVGLPAPIAFDPTAGGVPEAVDADHADPFAVEADDLSPRIVQAARLIRPLCVGALMAIPTVGTACVGIVALFSPGRAIAMADASTRFLEGIPTDVVALIGVLATGYGLAKTIEKRLGSKVQ